MKRLSQLVIAAILGSVITLGTYKAFETQPSPNMTDQIVVPQTTGSASVQLAKFTRLTAPASASALPINFNTAAANAMPAVVHIKSTQNPRTVQRDTRRQRQQNPFGDLFGKDFFEDLFGGGQPNQPRVGSGSGVIISKDGYIVTNNHVIDGADEMEVTLFDNRIYAATLVGTDPSTDIALLKIEETSLPILQFANSEQAQVGDWVLAVGNPFNLSSTVTAGIISAKSRNISILGKNSKAPIESFIQTDAAVNPGNSGGALVDTDGTLVGINTAIATPTGTYAGYSFAVPSNLVKKVVADLKEHGTVQRVFLGVKIADVNGQLAKEKDLRLTQGVYVHGLLEEGAALKAGVQQGDVIIAVNGTPIKSSPELQSLIGQQSPGDRVEITVDRNGREKNLWVDLVDNASNRRMLGANHGKATSQLLRTLGVDVKALSAKEVKSYGLKKGGVQITHIEPGVLTQNTDIEKGFIITKLNQKTITSVKEFMRILEANKGKGLLIEGTYPDYDGFLYYGFNF